MKIRLPDALHARPANLLVRAARKLGAVVWVHKEERRADAREILQVLSLRAAKGDEVMLSSESAEALAALADLMVSFDPDLVPETGMAAAAGVAIGEAVVLDDLEIETRVGEDDEETRAREAFATARRELVEILDTLADHERELFEPEMPILDSLEPAVLARIAAGESAEDAVRAEATHGPSDLVDDARARLLAALSGGSAHIARVLGEREDRELVLVTRELTPTLIAKLPRHVVGVIAVIEDMRETLHPPSASGTTSHAAILARGRSLPLIYVPEDVAATLVDGSITVIDTTGEAARVWGDPSEALVADARARRQALAVEAEAARQAARVAQTVVAVRANVGATTDDVPEAAAGIGLVRTELVFAAKNGAPREDEQAAAYRAIARKTSGPVYVRLFDAGGDKHLSFLPTKDDARGIALLLENDEVLRTQLRAIGRARASGDVRALIPLVRGAQDIESVRARAPENLPIGAMVETLAASHDALAIARAADFVCIGTNDLAADVLSASRESAPNGLDPRVLAAIRRTVEASHAAGRLVTVCGELAADPLGARVLVGLGVDALSVAAARVPAVTLDLATVTREDCQRAAATALGKE
ncbi:MAG: HPr family phosphocarrier protein [Polyangiales bacterium]